MADSRYAEYAQLMDNYKVTHDESLLKSAFHLLDLDGDSFISKDELLAYYRSRSDIEKAQFITESLFRMGDTNRDGFLDEKEFVVMVSTALNVQIVDEAENDMTPADAEFERLLGEYAATRNPKCLETLFNTIDSNHDGVITKEELKNSYLIKGTGDETTAANMLMTIGDLNQDGVLSLEEFTKLINGTLES